MPTFRSYAAYHWLPEQFLGLYALGPLVMLASAYLMWRSRRFLGMVEGSKYPLWMGYGSLGLSVFLKVVGETEGFTVLRGISLIPFLLGILAVLFPKPTVKAFLFPVLFLVFAVPMPPLLLDELTRPLLEINIRTVELVISFLGMSFELFGNTFFVTDSSGDAVHAVEMVAGCSGIRSLFTLITVASLYFYLRTKSLFQAAVLMLAAVGFAAVGNVLRVSSTILIIRNLEPEIGQSFFHDYSGYVIFVLVLLGILGPKRVLRW